MTVKELQKERKAAVKELEREIARVNFEYEKKIKLAENFGGLCDIYEAKRILGVSRQRIQMLIRQGRIRRDDSLFYGMLSHGDIMAYKKSPRKAGRPKGFRLRGDALSTRRGVLETPEDVCLKHGCKMREVRTTTTNGRLNIHYSCPKCQRPARKRRTA